MNTATMGLFGFGKKRTEKDWPFSDSPNTAVFTNRYAVNGKLISVVYHFEEDGAWQFTTDDPDSNSNAVMMIVSLEQIVARDSRLLELAGLPVGYRAFRETKDGPWEVNKHERSDED